MPNPSEAKPAGAQLSIYPPPVARLVRGEGARVWDDAGKDYVDLGGGIAVTSLGHAHPAIVDALSRQASALWHTSNFYANDARDRLVGMLTGKTFADRVFLCSSGAEANEAALKLARKRGIAVRPQKRKVVSFTGGFHGRIGFSLAASAGVGMGEPFGPPDGFVTSAFNDVEAAGRAVDDETCAVIVEPVQGEGGVNVASAGFLRALRELCDRHDALLVLDEVQSGAGRCGTLYRHMDCGVVPDLMSSAKGLGGGFPIGAMLATEEAAAALGAGDHGTTYGGNPLGCAVAAAVLEEIGREGFLAGVRERRAKFVAKLEEIDRRLSCFSEIRACGLLIGCDLSRGSAADLMRTAAAHGALVLKAGANAMRLAPCLNIGEAEVDEGFARLDAALQEALG